MRRCLRSGGCGRAVAARGEVVVAAVSKPRTRSAHSTSALGMQTPTGESAAALELQRADEACARSACTTRSKARAVPILPRAAAISGARRHGAFLALAAAMQSAPPATPKCAPSLESVAALQCVLTRDRGAFDRCSHAAHDRRRHIAFTRHSSSPARRSHPATRTARALTCQPAYPQPNPSASGAPPRPRWRRSPRQSVSRTPPSAGTLACAAS